MILCAGLPQIYTNVIMANNLKVQFYGAKISKLHFKKIKRHSITSAFLIDLGFDYAQVVPL